MSISVKDVEADINQIRTGAHAWITAHPFVAVIATAVFVALVCTVFHI